ncbi:MAG TPA: lipocalin family protein, partial [Dissulfurispiraceae bacterium]
RLEGGTKTMHLSAFDKDKELGIDLDLEADTPVVLNGEGGYSRKSEESPAMASIYFSYPSMKTEGRLRIGKRSFAVSGKSWFDREFSSRELGKNQAGWDWFAIQLDDNREIMLYEIRDKHGSVDRYSSGTFVYPDGAYRRLKKDDYSITVLDHYKSAHTGAHYPSGWKIAVPSENVSFTVTPLIKDQEFVATHSTGNYYWEGACGVTGNGKGRAYVELTGY